MKDLVVVPQLAEVAGQRARRPGLRQKPFGLALVNAWLEIERRTTHLRHGSTDAVGDARDSMQVSANALLQLFETRHVLERDQRQGNGQRKPVDRL
ncbi:hypothetical protein QCM80_27385 [Bradyrhizobium sp. SSUT112]|uniref:hypothetical protein n=1 Tax=Bradyrhizobium sp. SSUT112 TaxID=3040604 RepID=UPI002446B342|nr:hypothetical protein [Bradyrhizobium sp. SSUT112]MDH2354363.1 hypothetical protein [Bradyrhizobium sp. SSUT112]